MCFELCSVAARTLQLQLSFVVSAFLLSNRNCAISMQHIRLYPSSDIPDNSCIDLIIISMYKLKRSGHSPVMSTPPSIIALVAGREAYNKFLPCSIQLKLILRGCISARLFVNAIIGPSLPTYPIACPLVLFHVFSHTI